MDATNAQRLQQGIRQGEVGLNRLADLLDSGDLDAATETLKSAWSAFLEPLEVLAGAWDGEFWDDYTFRSAIEDNIERAQVLLEEATPDTLANVLGDLRRIIFVNLALTRRAIRLACADLGPAALDEAADRSAVNA
ncbi:hypothetical protein K8I61_03225 [bacterium]|nr:hypothetical protein [bacterium]